jgi:hypothetical protein
VQRTADEQIENAQNHDSRPTMRLHLGAYYSAKILPSASRVIGDMPQIGLQGGGSWHDREECPLLSTEETDQANSNAQSSPGLF